MVLLRIMIISFVLLLSPSCSMEFSNELNTNKKNDISKNGMSATMNLGKSSNINGN